MSAAHPAAGAEYFGFAIDEATLIAWHRLSPDRDRESCGLRGRAQQRRVRRDRHEREAGLDALQRPIAVPGQDPRGDARRLRRPARPGSARPGTRAHQTGPARRGHAIGRPGRRTGRPRPECAAIASTSASALTVSICTTPTTFRSPSAPPPARMPKPASPVVGGHAPVALRRIAQVADGVADFVGAVEAREHDTRGTQVEDSPGANPLGALDPNHHRHLMDPAASTCPASASSPPAPCSRSTTSQSNPARAQVSAASTEPRLTKVPRLGSPDRMRARSNELIAATRLLSGPVHESRDAGEHAYRTVESRTGPRSSRVPPVPPLEARPLRSHRAPRVIATVATPAALTHSPHARGRSRPRSAYS